jgi:hypothetical protein
MKQRGWECYGVDFRAPGSVELPSGIDFRFGTLEEMGYPKSFFQAITAWGVFEHLFSPKNYFKETSRILKEDGLLILLVPNARSLWSRHACKEDIPRHLHFFTARSIGRYAEETGLSVTKVEYTNRIYSRPATGVDMFRIKFLRAAGVPWKEIHRPQPTRYLNLVADLGGLLGRMLVHPRIEEFLGISGMMVVRLTK